MELMEYGKVRVVRGVTFRPYRIGIGRFAFVDDMQWMKVVSNEGRSTYSAYVDGKRIGDCYRYSTTAIEGRSSNFRRALTPQKARNGLPVEIEDVIDDRIAVCVRGGGVRQHRGAILEYALEAWQGWGRVLKCDVAAQENPHLMEYSRNG